ncbi:hypothetical protein BH10ACT8_BH10ACT8_14320 [soil metagenome]|jgi:hypothetical protein
MEASDFPTKSEFPYRALIRIRYQHELDLVLISQLQHAVAAVAQPALAAEFEAATSVVALSRLQVEREPVEHNALGAAFVAFDIDGPLCPDTPQDRIRALIQWLIDHGIPIPVPDPDPDPVYYRGDLAQVLVAGRDAVSAIASKEIAGDLHGALTGLAAAALR